MPKEPFYYLPGITNVLIVNQTKNIRKFKLVMLLKRFENKIKIYSVLLANLSLQKSIFVFQERIKMLNHLEINFHLLKLINQ